MYKGSNESMEELIKQQDYRLNKKNGVSRGQRRHPSAGDGSRSGSSE